MVYFAVVPILVSKFMIPDASEIVRGYSSNITFSLKLFNLHHSFGIRHALSNGTNFNVTISMTSDASLKRRKRNTVLEIGPFMTETSNTEMDVPTNNSIALFGEVEIMLSRENCPNVLSICCKVEPSDGLGTSYSIDLSDERYIQCIDISPVKNCLGKFVYMYERCIAIV